MDEHDPSWESNSLWGLGLGLDPEMREHYAAVWETLELRGLGAEAWPEALFAAHFDNRARLSALLLLLTTSTPGHEVEGGSFIRFSDPNADLIARLRRRLLPWDARTARTAVAAVAHCRPDDIRVDVALRAAERISQAGRADDGLLRALQDCRSRLAATDPDSGNHSPGVFRRVTRAIAAATPPDLLDLSPLQDGDAWVDQARDKACSHASEEVGPLVRALAQLGAGRASAAWLRAAEASLRPAAARQLLTSWL